MHYLVEEVLYFFKKIVTWVFFIFLLEREDYLPNKLWCFLVRKWNREEIDIGTSHGEI